MKLGKIKATNAGMLVPALRTVCRDCGHVILPGESRTICKVCGSRNIEMEEDVGRSVLVKCSS